MTHNIRKLSRDWFEIVWNQKDDAGIEKLAASDVIVHGLDENGKPQKGTELFKKFRRGFLTAFPDIHIDVEDVLVEGDKTAIRLKFFGTHTGNGIGIPPTGAEVRFDGDRDRAVARWENRRIVERIRRGGDDPAVAGAGGEASALILKPRISRMGTDKSIFSYPCSSV
jgi:predicted ester cyclase